MIKAWLQRIQERNDARGFEQGFKFAAGKLLRASTFLESDVEACIEELEMYAFDPWDYRHPFDKGIIAAIAAWRKNERG